MDMCLSVAHFFGKSIGSLLWGIEKIVLLSP